MNESFWDAHGVEIEAWANFFNQREWEVDGLTIKFGDLRIKKKIECGVAGRVRESRERGLAAPSVVRSRGCLFVI